MIRKQYELWSKSFQSASQSKNSVDEKLDNYFWVIRMENKEELLDIFFKWLKIAIEISSKDKTICNVHCTPATKGV